MSEKTSEKMPNFRVGDTCNVCVHSTIHPCRSNDYRRCLLYSDTPNDAWAVVPHYYVCDSFEPKIP